MFRIFTTDLDDGSSCPAKDAGPTFEKSKIARKSSSACDHCRKSKLKCTGERSGSRGLGRGLTRTTSPSDRRHLTTQAILPAPTMTGVPPSSNALECTPANLHMTGTPPIDRSSTDSGITLSDFGSIDFDSSIDDEVLALLGSGTPDLESVFSRNHQDDAAQDIPANPPLQLDSIFLADHSGTVLSRFKDHNVSVSGGCGCVKRLLQIQEQVTIRTGGHGYQVARGSSVGSSFPAKSPLEVYDILHFYKTALGQCADVLHCDSCQHESAIVMLLITLCGDMLTELILLVPQSSSDDAFAAQEGLFAAPRAASDPESALHMRTFRLSTALSGARASSDVAMSAGWRDLDQDDHIRVVKALVAPRLEMLSALIQGLGRLAQHCSWSHHLTRLNAMHERLTSANIR
ncbi:hypothetical protein F4778DRAFT_789554 [Xylariomycetidae sp. FL2044]|nr:hypothetical protein F4778DRAFT_789554 [Xylariomycetidae sp. FL2044]